MKNLRKTQVLVPTVVVAVLLFGPIAVSFLCMGSKTLFNFLAGDSMYYMGIANNYLKYGIPTFDGTSAINGFHPLWELILIAVFKIFSISHHNQIYVTFALSALFVYLAYVLMSSTFIKILGMRVGIVATLTFFLGVYSVVFEPRRHWSGDPGVLYTFSPYSTINGMETPLSMALWAAFFVSLVARFYAYDREGKRPQSIADAFPLSSRLILALLILCRLDDIFLVAAIGIFVLSQNGFSLHQKAISLTKILWITIFAIFLYVLYNHQTVGVFLPVSGTSKLSIHEFYGSTLYLNFRGIFSPHVSFEFWWIYACRIYPLAISFIFGATIIAFGWKHRNIDSRERSLKQYLVLFGIFIVFKSTFLLSFVPLMNQGYWYYFEMIGICNAAFAFAVGFYLKTEQRMTKPALLACLLILVFRTPNDISFMKTGGTYSDVGYSLWTNSKVIRGYLLAHNPALKLIDNLDGTFVYLLDIPGDSITGLASSPEELQRREKMGKWTSLVSRGINVVPDHGYYDPQTLSTDSGESVRVAEEFRPPSSPVSFYRLEIVHAAMPHPPGSQ